MRKWSFIRHPSLLTTLKHAPSFSHVTKRDPLSYARRARRHRAHQTDMNAQHQELEELSTLSTTGPKRTGVPLDEVFLANSYITGIIIIIILPRLSPIAWQYQLAYLHRRRRRRRTLPPSAVRRRRRLCFACICSLLTSLLCLSALPPSSSFLLLLLARITTSHRNSALRELIAHCLSVCGVRDMTTKFHPYRINTLNNSSPSGTVRPSTIGLSTRSSPPPPAPHRTHHRPSANLVSTSPRAGIS